MPRRDFITLVGGAERGWDSLMYSVSYYGTNGVTPCLTIWRARLFMVALYTNVYHQLQGGKAGLAYLQRVY